MFNTTTSVGSSDFACSTERCWCHDTLKEQGLSSCEDHIRKVTQRTSNTSLRCNLPMLFLALQHSGEKMSEK